MVLFEVYYCMTEGSREEINMDSVILLMICIFVPFMIICFLMIAFIARRAKKRNRQETEIQPLALNGKNLTKEQRILVQEQYKAYRKKLYEGYPQVEKFEKRKVRWLWGLIIAGFILRLVQRFMTVGLEENVLASLIIVIGATISHNFIFLGAAMGPEWKLAFFLYPYVLMEAFSFINSLTRAGITSCEILAQVLAVGLRQNLLAVCVDICQGIYILLILLTAIWLTLIRNNREMAEQSKELNRQLKKFQPTGISREEEEV